jgi:hypothetical protein
MSETKTPSFRKLMNQWQEVVSRNLLFVISLLLLVYCYFSYREYGLDLWSWDMMFISGILAFILALYMARTIPDRMTQTIDRLTARRVFEISSDTKNSIKSKVTNRAQRFAKISALVVGLIMFVSFIWAFGNQIIYHIPLTILEILLGMVAGYYIGQMIAFGSLGQLIRSEKIPVVATPGHIDQAAGLKPIGDFYFFQAMVLAVPCAYIAAWWIIIPLLPQFSHWRDPYLTLLAIAITFEILSFFVPMWIFHQIMQEQKIKHLKEADGLCEEIIKLEERILNADDSESVSDVPKQLDFLREKYWNIEQMPTWPVDALIRRKFTRNNLILFLPFFIDMFKSSDPWKKFLDFIIKFLGT